MRIFILILIGVSWCINGAAVDNAGTYHPVEDYRFGNERRPPPVERHARRFRLCNAMHPLMPYA